MAGRYHIASGREGRYWRWHNDETIADWPIRLCGQDDPAPLFHKLITCRNWRRDRRRHNSGGYERSRWNRRRQQCLYGVCGTRFRLCSASLELRHELRVHAVLTRRRPAIAGRPVLLSWRSV